MAPTGNPLVTSSAVESMKDCCSGEPTKAPMLLLVFVQRLLCLKLLMEGCGLQRFGLLLEEVGEKVKK